MKITYQKTDKGKLKLLFTLHTKELDIPGQVYEREDDTRGLDPYYTCFAGMFPWQVGQTLPPLRYLHAGEDHSFTLFLGVPQGILKALFDCIPQAAARYRSGTYRNCNNCEYLQFETERWEEYRDRPVSERFAKTPRSFHTCAVSGDAVDHLAEFDTRSSTYLLRRLQQSVKENSCEAHTRKAYKVTLGADAPERARGETDRWVSSELRRLGYLNPAAISYKSNTIILPGNIIIPYQEAL